MVYLSEKTLKTMREKIAAQSVTPVKEKVETTSTENTKRPSEISAVAVIPTTFKPWDSYTRKFCLDLLSIDIPVVLLANNLSRPIPAEVVETPLLYVVEVSERDFNYSRLNNLGREWVLKNICREPLCPWIIYANDDLSFVDKDSLKALKTFVDTHTPFRTVEKLYSGVILNLDRSVQRCGGRLTPRGPQALHVVPKVPTHYELMGGPFHIASPALEWDENLPHHLNDDDVSLVAGGTTVIPAIKLFHQMNTTTGPALGASGQHWAYFRAKHRVAHIRARAEEVSLPASVKIITPKTVDDIDQIIILQTDHIGDHAFTVEAREQLLHKFPDLPILCLGGSFILPLLQNLYDSWGVSNVSYLPFNYREEGGCRARIVSVPQEQILAVREQASPNSLLVNFRIDGSDSPLFSMIPHKYLASMDRGDFSIRFDPHLPVYVSQSRLIASIPGYIPLNHGFGETVRGLVVAPFASIPQKECPLTCYAALEKLVGAEWGLKVHYVAHGEDRKRLPPGMRERLLPDVSIPKLGEILCKESWWYVGNDSGPSHWMAKYGIPTLIVHPPQTNPVMLSIPTSHCVLIHPAQAFTQVTDAVWLKALGILSENVLKKVRRYRHSSAKES